MSINPSNTIIDISKNWKDVKGALSAQMTKATFDAYFLKSTAVMEGHDLIITLPNQYAVGWVENRLDRTVKDAVEKYGMMLPKNIIYVAEEGIEVMHDEGAVFTPDYDDGDNPQNQVGDQVKIAVISNEPTRAFLAVPHYAARFWRPYLGSVPFSLWEVLRSYGFGVSMGFSEWPTVEMIVDTLGQGVSRAAVMGRAQTEKRPRQIGAIERLQGARIIHYEKLNNGRQTRYEFSVLDDLPLLTPLQVAKLTERKKAEHSEYLSRYKGFDVAAWEQIQGKSLIPAYWWQ